MAGSLSRADLVADLKASLLDAAGSFRAPDDADFERHLDRALTALTAHRASTLAGEISLVEGVEAYAAPADLWKFKMALWGMPGGAMPKPWEKSWPGRLPDVREISADSGTVLWLSPAPTAQQIAALGATYRFFYYARLVVGTDAADTTVSENDRGLLILRAQAEAMRELAVRDAVRPTTARDGVSGRPAVGTAAALYNKFLAEFNAMVAP